MISRTEFFWNHILVLLMVFAYTFLMSYGLYWITNKLVPLCEFHAAARKSALTARNMTRSTA